jgi:hypothetical protein
VIASPEISIEHLQSRLLRLIDEVRHRGTEPPSLRAEVLLAINRLCSPELLSSLWTMLEKVGAREELLLVRLLGDVDGSAMDGACRKLLQSGDPHQRAIALAVSALRGERSDARRLAEHFSREPELVLQKAANQALAPYSFVTCLLAAVRDFHVPLFANLLAGILRRFADGQTELELIEALLDDERHELAQIGFVTLASRFMGRLQRYVYDDVVGGQPRTLTRTELSWMQRSLSLCPEVLEAVAEPLPAGTASPEFMRARIRVLAQIAEEQVATLVSELSSGQRRLRSLVIEAALSGEADSAERHAAHGRSLAYLLSVLLGHRPGLVALMDGLQHERELETVVMAKALELGGDAGAINVACALLGHWHELQADDPDQGPFRRWIESLWRDDRHRQLEQGIDAALGCPDESAIYAAQIISSLGDPLGVALRAVIRGQLVDLATLSPLSRQSRCAMALRALLRAPELEPHPQTLINIARAGMLETQPSLRSLERHRSPAIRKAVWAAMRLCQSQRCVYHHPLYRQLQDVGLEPVDREFCEGEQAEERLEGRSPAALAALKRTTGERVLMDVYFWFASASLPNIVGTRPASGYAARAQFVVDLESQRVQHAAWYDRAGREHVNTRLPPAPSDSCESFHGIAWDTPIESMADAVGRLGGTVLSVARMGHGSPASRMSVRFGERTLRLEIDDLGRFFRALLPLEVSTLDAGVRELEASWRQPTFRTDSTVVWRFDQLECGIRPDPAFDKLAQYVMRTRD